MKIRVRGPIGQEMHLLPDTATISDLHDAISEQTSLQSFDIKHGYPPRPLELHGLDKGMKLSELGIRLDGEQLIISQSLQMPAEPSTAPVQQKATPDRFPTNNAEAAQLGASQKPLSTKENSGFSFKDFGKPPSPAPATPQKPLSLSRKQSSKQMDAPEFPVITHGATMVLRIMPDDNSCLFRAFNTAFFGDMDNVIELRSIIAQIIQANPDLYTEVVLDQKPDEYCRWIQTEDAWGGSIELGILSKHFDIEICSIDVKTLRIDRYNEGMPKRCVLVYSGIHYDAIALSPSDFPHKQAHASPESDIKVFDSSDDLVLQTAVELCMVLQEKHYYTDTSDFTIRCNICGFMAKGEKGATEHASQTGHMNFGEAEH